MNSVRADENKNILTMTFYIRFGLIKKQILYLVRNKGVHYTDLKFS